MMCNKDEIKLSMLKALKVLFKWQNYVQNYLRSYPQGSQRG